LWNELMLMKLPKRKSLKIYPHNDADFTKKMYALAYNTDASLYFKSHLSLFCTNKCTSKKLLMVSDLYALNITKLFVEEFPSPDENVPLLLAKLKNLKQIHISRAHWSTRFTFTSQSLQSITLQNCLGMRTMKFLCPSLRLFIFDRGILEIPFLEDVGERKLRFAIQSSYHVDVVVKGLSLNNLKLHCVTKSTFLHVVKCLGVYLKLASRAIMDIALHKCSYPTVLIEGDNITNVEMRDMKLKVLKLRCAKLQKLNTTDCVIKTTDYSPDPKEALRDSGNSGHVRKSCK
jgi:hypothetical protein